MGIGDWGLGIGDWGLGIGPIPNPQSPIPNPQVKYLCILIKNKSHFLIRCKNQMVMDLYLYNH